MTRNTGHDPLLVIRALLVMALAMIASRAEADERDVASRMFMRLTGQALALDDPRRAQMESLIRAGQRLEAARIATDDPSFYNVTLPQWSGSLSNRERTARQPVNDFMALIIGMTRDDLDFRRALTDDIVYTIDSIDLVIPNDTADPYIFKPFTNLAQTTAFIAQPHFGLSEFYFGKMDRHRYDFKRFLIRTQQSTMYTRNVSYSVLQPAPAEFAGLLTTSHWDEVMVEGGTNRRPIAFALETFLCQSLESMRVDASVPDDRVRRDVDRLPSGSNEVYQNTCRGCHATMDALAGAYAYFTTYSDGASPSTKMNQNNTVYPQGFVTRDNTWVGRFTQSQLETVINRPDGTANLISGTGVRDLGTMLSNSKAFPRCMAKRVAEHVCNRPMTAADSADLATLSQNFIANGYKLRGLFEAAATLTSCVGQ